MKEWGRKENMSIRDLESSVITQDLGHYWCLKPRKILKVTCLFQEEAEGGLECAGAPANSNNTVLYTVLVLQMLRNQKEGKFEHSARLLLRGEGGILLEGLPNPILREIETTP